ncbi:MAG: response regulator [Candidatus Kapaibacterium sp.]
MAKKILIVDDEPDVVTYLSTFFQDNGYEVATAANGREAFEKAVSEEPDLITLDITMPEESGVRCFRDLQENEKTKSIPVIIVTGVSGEFKHFIESRRQVSPPVSYFEKPIDRSKLLAKVKEIVG